MSYDYMLFRSGGHIPASAEEINPEDSQPFESFDEVRALLSKHCPAISWNEADQTGKIENETGRFEFQCFAPLIAMGTLGLKTSFRQDIEESQRFISELCKLAGFYAIDEQSLQILG